MPGTTPSTGGQTGETGGGAVVPAPQPDPTPTPTPTTPDRHRARNVGFTLGADKTNFLGVDVRSRLTSEVWYSPFKDNKTDWSLHNGFDYGVYFRLIYIVNEGVGAVSYRVSKDGLVHKSDGAFGDNGQWRYIYDVYLPPRTHDEIYKTNTFHTFELIVYPSTRPVSPRIQWYLNSSKEDSHNWPYPSPILYNEDDLDYPYLNSRVNERDETEFNKPVTVPLSPGQYRLLADVGNGYVYTLYHQLVNKYASAGEAIPWTVGYLPGGNQMTIYQTTPNGDGYLDVTGSAPSWSESARVMEVVPVGRLFAVGYAGQYLASSVNGFSVGAYASSLASYDTMYVGDPANALLFDFVAV